MCVYRARGGDGRAGRRLLDLESLIYVCTEPTPAAYTDYITCDSEKGVRPVGVPGARFMPRLVLKRISLADVLSISALDSPSSATSPDPIPRLPTCAPLESLEELLLNAEKSPVVSENEGPAETSDEDVVSFVSGAGSRLLGCIPCGEVYDRDSHSLVMLHKKLEVARAQWLRKPFDKPWYFNLLERSVCCVCPRLSTTPSRIIHGLVPGVRCFAVSVVV